MIGRASVWLAAVALVAGSGCGGPDSASPDSSRAPATTATGDPMVDDRRAVTEAERRRIDGADDRPTLDCDNVTARTWDYGPIGPDDPRGRSAEDALRDAILEINHDLDEGAGPSVSEANWIELVEHPGRSTFIAAIRGKWTALIVVGGDPDLGVWRHQAALTCQS